MKAPTVTRSLLLCMSTLVAGCPHGSPSPDVVDAPSNDGSITQTIDSTGGTIRFEDVTLTIPPGAVSNALTITIRRDTAPLPSDYTAFSAVYEFEPAGTTFAVPASVTYRFTGDPAVAQLYWTASDDATRFDPVMGYVANGTITGSIEHFSRGFVGTGTTSVGSHIGPDAFRVIDMGLNFSPRHLDEVPINGTALDVIVVGTIQLPSGQDHAAWWAQSWGLQDLHPMLSSGGSQPLVQSYATHIGSGVVGYSIDQNASKRAFVIANGGEDGAFRARLATGAFASSEALCSTYQGEYFAFGSFIDPMTGANVNGGVAWDSISNTLGALPGPGARNFPVDCATDVLGNHLPFVSELGGGFGLQGTDALRGDARTGTYEVLNGFVPTALNARGQVVGRIVSSSAEGVWTTALPTAMDVSRIPTPRFGSSGGDLMDINDAGFAVGATSMYIIGGDMFGGGTLPLAEMRRVDVNDILPPTATSMRTRLSAVVGINNGFVMAGTGSIGPAGSGGRGLLLIPTFATTSPPMPPDSLMGSLSDAPGFPAVDLVWNDRSLTETWYELELSVNDEAFRPRANLPANSVRFHDDQNITSGSTIRYRIRSRNFSGVSMYSHEAVVTIP